MTRLAAILLLLCLPFEVGAIILVPASMNEDDVAAKVVVAGQDWLSTGVSDIITPPAGTATWTYPLIVNYPMVLLFAGSNNATIIWNRTANTTPASSNACFLFYTTNQNALVGGQPIGTNMWRRSGVTLTNSGTQANSTKPAVQWYGDGWNCMDDQNASYNLNCTFLQTYGPRLLIWKDLMKTGVNVNCIEITAQNLYGALNSDGAWTNVDQAGTSNLVYIDNCSLYSTAGNASFAAVDATAGGLFWMNFNYISNMFVQCHGTESGGPAAGPRECGGQSNYWAFSFNCASVINIRASGGDYWQGNNVQLNSGGSFNQFIGLDDNRTHAGFQYWGPANGTNILDVNNTANPIFTATATSANTQNALNADFSGLNWTENQGVGYIMWDVSQPGGVISGNGAQTTWTNFSIVTANFATFSGLTIIDWYANGGYAANLQVKIGDTVWFQQITNTLDMPGMGKRNKLFNSSGTLVYAAPQQAVSPIYSWGNTNVTTGADIGITTLVPEMKLGTHFFNDTPMPGFVPWTYPDPRTQALSPPLFTIQPQGGSVSLGSSYTFTWLASGNPSPTYQLYSNSIVVAGATGTSYNIPSVVAGDATTWYVIASNSQGTQQSQNAILTVGGTSPPSIVTQPANVLCFQTQNVGFSVTATGSLPLYYTWTFNGNLLQAPGSSVSLPNVQVSQVGQYQVIITNLYGAVTSSVATLNLSSNIAMLGTTPANSGIQFGNGTNVQLQGNAP